LEEILVKTEIRLKGSCRQALTLSAGVSLMLLAVSGMQAATLWHNGDVNSGTFTAVGSPGGGNPCDSTCGAPTPAPGGPFTIFDNFQVTGSAWNVNGFTFADFLVGSPTVPSNKNVTWSLWNGDPSIGTTKLIASGTVAASLTQPGGYNCFGSNCLVQFNVNVGPSVVLGAGTYYLGTTVESDPTVKSYRATTDQVNAYGWQASIGSFGAVGEPWSGTTPLTFGFGTSNSGVSGNDSVFDILGTTDTSATPEPGTLLMLTLAFTGLGIYGRRRLA